jgi:hypothetical protein
MIGLVEVVRFNVGATFRAIPLVGELSDSTRDITEDEPIGRFELVLLSSPGSRSRPAPVLLG